MRKFAAAMRAMDKDPDPLTEAELRELVDTFGAVTASGDATAADADANDDEDADADGDGAEEDSGEGDDDE